MVGRFDKRAGAGSLFNKLVKILLLLVIPWCNSAVALHPLRQRWICQDPVRSHTVSLLVSVSRMVVEKCPGPRGDSLEKGFLLLEIQE